MHYAGLDWGGHHHQLAIVNDCGEQQVNQRFEHDVKGIDDLVDLLAEFRPHGVAIERADGLLIETLQAVGHTIYPVSPRASARARERHQAAARKNDRFDAFVLAETLRTDGHRWRPLSVPSPLLAELRAVVRHRRQAVAAHLKVSSQLQACLDAYNPALGQVFSAIDRDATLALIRRYSTPDKAARVTQDRMARFCQRIGYSGRVDPEVLHRRLHDSLLAGSEGSIDGHAFAAMLLADQLEMLTGQVKRYDKHIAALFERHPDREIFASFPAVGPVIGPELLNEIGEDRHRFSRADHPRRVRWATVPASVTRLTSRIVSS